MRRVVEREKKKKKNPPDTPWPISKENKIPNGNDGLFIEHVELLGDGCREEAGAKDGCTGVGT